jgi:hypothetical protein
VNLYPVPNVTLTLTGDAVGSTLSDSSGNYTFTGLAAGGTYIVTPTKTSLAPGSAGIDIGDIITTQRHFLDIAPPVTGCQLAAADVDGDNLITTADVIAIQRFVLGLSTGIFQVGDYQFSPASRTYPGVVNNQTAQSYDTLVFGDVASPFVEEPVTGPIVAYSFNEGSGTTVTDASGHGVTGTIQGATWTAGGRYGNALSFDGSSSYVDLGNPALLQITGSMTWSAWVKAGANPADDGEIVAKSDSTSGWQLKTSPDTGPQTFGIRVSGGGTTLAKRYSTSIRSLGVWYHVAGVYDASATTLSVYVNGVLDNGALIGTIPASQVNSAVNVNIGRRTGGFYFNGVIDEVRIYNRALSAAEVQADMNTPISGP